MKWRKLYASVVADPCLLKLPFWGRWLWVCMICEADDQGRIYADPSWWRNRALIGQKRPSIRSVSDTMAALIEHKLLSFCPEHALSVPDSDASVPDPDLFRSAFETGSLPKYLRLTNWHKLQARAVRPRREEMREKEREKEERDPREETPRPRGGEPAHVGEALAGWKERRRRKSE